MVPEGGGVATQMRCHEQANRSISFRRREIATAVNGNERNKTKYTTKWFLLWSYQPSTTPTATPSWKY
jgi:hypothetical protein